MPKRLRKRQGQGGAARNARQPPDARATGEVAEWSKALPC